MKATEHLSFSIGHNTLHWLIASYLLLILPLYGELQPLIYLCALVIVGWRYAIARDRVKPPATWLKNTIALAGCGLIITFWRSSGLLPAMFNLLVLGCTLKFLEFNSRRHLSLHILSLYFLAALAFIYHQGLAFTLYLLLVCGLNSIALISVYQNGTYRAQSRLGVRLVLQSLPLTALLFLLIPHLGPMWRLPDIKNATTGLTETVNPGDIANLSRSSALAFRASFDGAIPPENDRYWRALVHEEFDGKSWRIHSIIRSWLQQQEHPLTQSAPLKNFINWRGPATAYRIIPEPTQQHWLYSLDYSRPDNDDALLTPAMTLYAVKVLQQKQQFPLTYFPQTRVQTELAEYQRQINLQLPANINPQTQTLVTQLRLQYRDNTAFATAVMRYFATQGFSYTLNPPVLAGNNQIDDFLFGSRRGFCAHFASAFTYLMRTAGIPARMVTGYLGGEYHANGNYLSVYQFDAHAWSEVWLNDHWQRFDPTMMVAPDRLSRSIDEVLPAEETRLRDPFSLTSYRNILLLAELHAWMADIDYRWTSWVLNYNNQSQESLLRDLFGSSLFGRALAMVGGLVVVISLAFVFSWLTRKHIKQDPLLRAYLVCCQKLGKQGMPRLPGETPLAYLQRLEQAQHPSGLVMRQITDLYQLASYAGADRHKATRKIRQLGRQL